MGALNLQNNSDEARTHIEILTEMLRDVDIEGRMTTLIKADEFVSGTEMNQIQLQSLRLDLENELNKVRKMIFMVEKAQYLMNK